ncbi:phospho-2-dehydro-3-deoxyheptonate aldolase [Salmonella enterica subsp. enterica serovar Typhimurium str. DT104]|nr:phospho-2-dehydro-3-deoxyheptonate aldolase [Salmonella enterica subsp. enterica serovar Typhimurium str. DT104]
MNYQNDDLRIKEINELLPPVALLEKFPATENAAIPLLTRAKPSIKFSKAMTIVCWW